MSTRWEDTPTLRKLQVLEYLKADVMGLLELYEKVNQPIWDKFETNMCDFVTSSSQSYKLWVTKFLDHELGLPNAKQEQDFRASIYGGRTYKNKNRFKSKQYDAIMQGLLDGSLKYEDVNDFIFDSDVCSLYPSVMKDGHFPIGQAKDTNVFRSNKLGIYYIKYETNKKLLTPILPRRQDGKLKWDLVDSEGWYTSVDIDNALAHGYWIDIVKGYYWEKSAKVFEKYIDHFYQMKQNATKGTPQYLLAKLWLNALYGKTIQKSIRTQDHIVKTHAEFWKILNDNIIIEMNQVGNVWLVKSKSKEEEVEKSLASKPTQLGAFILSYSRVLMSKYYDQCPNTKEGMPFYYDTDSLNVHSSCLKEYGGKIEIDSSLGGVMDDVGGKVIEAYWICPKMYTFKYLTPDLKIKYHFRGKGVNVLSSIMLENRNNNLTTKEIEELTFEEYKLMDAGKSRTYIRAFQIKRIGMKKSSKEENDFFTLKHYENTSRTVNTCAWQGRNFIDNQFSVPWGYVN